MMNCTCKENKKMRVAETRNFGTELWLRDYKLAELKDEKLYRYIDDIDSFKNVDECNNAYADVEEFEEDWLILGATLHIEDEETEESDFVDFDNNLEDEAEKCLTCCR